LALDTSIIERENEKEKERERRKYPKVARNFIM